MTALNYRENTAAQAITSVTAQSYCDVAHLIIEGASIDGTLSWVWWLTVRCAAMVLEALAPWSGKPQQTATVPDKVINGVDQASVEGANKLCAVT